MSNDDEWERYLSRLLIEDGLYAPEVMNNVVAMNDPVGRGAHEDLVRALKQDLFMTSEPRSLKVVRLGTLVIVRLGLAVSGEPVNCIFLPVIEDASDGV